jgi:hypothetical protein
VILSFGAFEKVKLYKALDFFEMTVARHPDLLECSFGPFSNLETVHGDKHKLGLRSFPFDQYRVLHRRAILRPVRRHKTSNVSLTRESLQNKREAPQW